MTSCDIVLSGDRVLHCFVELSKIPGVLNILKGPKGCPQGAPRVPQGCFKCANRIKPPGAFRAKQTASSGAHQSQGLDALCRDSSRVSGDSWANSWPLNAFVTCSALFRCSLRLYDSICSFFASDSFSSVLKVLGRWLEVCAATTC